MNEMNMNTMNTDPMNMNTETSMPRTAGAMPQDTKIDDKAIKRLAGEAISQVDGVLGVDGGLTDVLKASDDVTKGLSITLSEDGKNVQVSAKIITEYGKNIPGIVTNVQDKIRDALQNMAGLTVEKVEVEVTDTMTPDEYKAKSNKTLNRS